ncbi:hypothetical protein KKE60_06190 [Patescibacteria group bacterium]|nr:hypothetical protein [Patescibacteria group bacterium]
MARKEPLYPHVPKGLRPALASPLIKTIYLKLYSKSRLVYTATVRSDWTISEFTELARLFPDTYIRTARSTIPVRLLGQKYHNTDFLSLSRKKLL